MKFEPVPKMVVPMLDMRYSDPFVLISICSPEETSPSIPKNCIDILRVEFHDVDKKVPGFILFSSKHADKILKFYYKYKNKVETLVVHCAGGISRSPAVAAALYEIHYGFDDERYWDKYVPNRWVYSEILRWYKKVVYSSTLEEQE